MCFHYVTFLGGKWAPQRSGEGKKEDFYNFISSKERLLLAFEHAQMLHLIWSCVFAPYRMVQLFYSILQLPRSQA